MSAEKDSSYSNEEESSDSDVSFNEEFSLFEDFSKLTPFSFEPLLSSDDDEYYTADENEMEESQKSSRLKQLNWCNCNKCQIMETEIECICCGELNEITEEKFEGMKQNILCILSTIIVSSFLSTITSLNIWR